MDKDGEAMVKVCIAANPRLELDEWFKTPNAKMENICIICDIDCDSTLTRAINHQYTFDPLVEGGIQRR
jgi:hypothetical protein